MGKLDMDSLFRRTKGEVRKPKKINYDVRITHNHCGKNSVRIRFSFYNKAADAFKPHDYIEISDLEYIKDRIYFCLHDGEKPRKRAVRIIPSSKSKQTYCYAAITPSTDKAEKIYRTNWCFKNYNLMYDEENELYYIEKDKEDKTNA